MQSYIDEIKQLVCFESYACTVEKLASGHSHLCFKVLAINTKSKVAVEYFVKSLSAHTSTEQNERLAADLASSSEVGPRIIYQSIDWLVTEFIIGKSLEESVLSDKAKIALSIQALQEFHQLKPRKGITYLSIEKLILDLSNHTCFTHHQKSMLTSLTQQILAFDEPKGTVMCHGDVNFSNIIIDQHSKPWLIDFECAAIGNVEFDIAMFIAINHLPDNYLEYIFDCYQKHNNVSISHSLVQSYLACCYLINGLWYQGKSNDIESGSNYLMLANKQYKQFDLLNLSKKKLVKILL